jgi:hypothetical protein
MYFKTQPGAKWNINLHRQSLMLNNSETSVIKTSKFFLDETVVGTF